MQLTSGDLLVDQPGHARDVFAFGVFAEYILEYLASLGAVTERFQSRVQEECLNVDPRKRPKLSSLLDDDLFRTDYVEICNFLKRITMKTSEEKKSFFTVLTRRLFSLPEELLASRLVRPLMSRFVVLEPLACEYLMPHLLTPAPGERRASAYEEEQLNPLIAEPLFRRSVIPELYKIFHVHDVHVRTVLLTHFHRYVRLFDGAVLADEIFPEILLSLRDANDGLVTLSLRAIAELVPILGGNIIIGADRVKLFSEGVPRFCSSSGRIESKLNGSAAVSSVQVEGSEGREAERQRKREESRKRMMERRMKNEENRRQSLTASYANNIAVDDAIPLDYNSHSTTIPKNSQEFPRSVERHDHIGDAANDVRVDSPDARERRWSLDDADTPPYVQPTDSDIELEIENELIALESTSPPVSNPNRKSLEKLKLPDEGIQSEVLSAAVDWSDVSSRRISSSGGGQRSNQGVLKLAGEPAPRHSSQEEHSQLTNSSQKPLTISHDNDKRLSHSARELSVARGHREIALKADGKFGNKSVSNAQRIESKLSPAKQTADFDDWSEASWEPVDMTPVRASKKSTADSRLTNSSSASNYVRTNSITRRQNQPLGAEFDIMQIDIKTLPAQTKEFDFFADMTPQIRPAEKGILGILNANVKSVGKIPPRTDPDAERRTMSEKTDGKSVFEVTQSGKMDEGDGWDSELNLTIEGT